MDEKKETNDKEPEKEVPPSAPVTASLESDSQSLSQGREGTENDGSASEDKSKPVEGSASSTKTSKVEAEPVRKEPEFWRKISEGFRGNCEELKLVWNETRARIRAELKQRRMGRRPSSRNRIPPVRSAVPEGETGVSRGSSGWLAESLETQGNTTIRPIQPKDVQGRFKEVLIVGGLDFFGAALAEQLNAEGFRDLVLCDALTPQSFGRLGELKFQEFMTVAEFRAFAAQRIRSRRMFSHIFYLGKWDEEDYVILKTLLGALQEEGGRLITVSSSAALGDCAVEHRNDPEKFLPSTLAGMMASLFDRYTFQKASHRGHLSLKHYQLHAPGRGSSQLAALMDSCLDQIARGGEVRLPSALRPDSPEGGRVFDFLSVREAARRAIYLSHNRLAEGVYELGSGQAVTPVAFCEQAFAAAGKEARIVWDDAISYEPPAAEPPAASLARLEKTGWSAADVKSLDFPENESESGELKPDPEKISSLPATFGSLKRRTRPAL